MLVSCMHVYLFLTFCPWNAMLSTEMQVSKISLLFKPSFIQSCH